MTHTRNMRTEVVKARMALYLGTCSDEKGGPWNVFLVDYTIERRHRSDNKQYDVVGFPTTLAGRVRS